MKKIFTFLIITFIFTIIKVNAASTNFYEGEYIDNIYMNKVKDNTIYYQKARFFRETSTNNPTYCIEPFAFFNESSTYTESTSIQLNQSQLERISLLAYYGYNYQNHTDNKWYAITQFLIWQTADPTGKYYFTDTLNGNKISKFETEISELENLINNHYTKPSFDSQTFYVVYNNTLVIKDNNNILTNYQVTSNNATINNNFLVTEKLEPGTYTINLQKPQTYTNTQKIYTSTTSQDMITIGNIDPVTTSVTLIVQETNLEITKIDKNTKTTTPQGDASLIGATFGLYNSFGDKLQEYTLTEPTLNITNLNYGNYYLQEITPGEGYKLNKTKYNFSITKNTPTISINIDNEVITKKIIIKKLYGSANNFQPETNISFNIYNSNDEFITTIKTNDQGIATINLPFGTYTIKQLTTTEGYQKVDPVHIVVDNEEELSIELKNYKISVPDTYKEQNLFSTIQNILKKICQSLKSLLF